MAREYGLDAFEQELLFYASPLHDIGKVGIRDDMLLKPGRLTLEEFEHMKSHSQIGYDILKNSENPFLQAGALIARTHHEKYDGSGYPMGLEGKAIHRYGRITAIAGVFDALTSQRPYRRQWSTWNRSAAAILTRSSSHASSKKAIPYARFTTPSRRRRDADPCIDICAEKSL